MQKPARTTESMQYAQKACAAYFAFTIFYVPTAYYLLAFAMNYEP
ncbi:MAG: hypothetical protein NTU69_10550 [Proteobacteria bacterium]|nr:hypothetical protein [Pseudomonadota bacterium]